MILNGKKLAERILNDLKREVAKLSPIKLAVILVGNDPNSLKFVKQKKKAAEKIGINFELHRFKSNISEQELVEKIKKIVKLKTNTGIVVQLPLPPRIDVQKIINLIPKEKDPDALSVDNFLVESPVASGIIKLLKEYGIKLKGKKVVIVGRGRLVGKPLIAIMKKAGVDLVACDIYTKNLSNQTLKADILISATGSPGLIKAKMIKRGTVVIDAGTGDVDFERIKNKVGFITPPIGGVGPMTVAMLMSNLVKLAKSK